MTKTISIWGSTGSIGRQTLEVVAQNPDKLQVRILTAHRNAGLLLEQAKQFRPELAVVTGDCDRATWEPEFKKAGIRIVFGKAALLDAASAPVDVAVNALVGAAGLEATFLAVDAGVDIALANKEVLVMAGELVISRVAEKDVKLLPIDSEHSALFQCLQGEPKERIKKILLTASGGPFRDKPIEAFESITVEDALNHPNWDMGQKVTIDSSTLINKGLEVIEARWLFGLEADQIGVVIHPQSIIHSMVEFVDGSLKAQLGYPDMRVPIAYALSWPDRWEASWGSQDFADPFELNFYSADMQKFLGLQLAYDAVRACGTAPATYNAADEVAVELFLAKKIRYTQIAELVEQALTRHRIIRSPNLEEILHADRSTREFIRTKMKQKG